jgi:phosphoglycerol transferase MdoB-like AlkP superfamily enzyme
MDLLLSVFSLLLLFLFFLSLIVYTFPPVQTPRIKPSTVSLRTTAVLFAFLPSNIGLVAVERPFNRVPLADLKH